MKRIVLIGFKLLLIAGLVASVIPCLSQPAFGQAASKEAPHVGQGGLPQFQLDPNVPKLPAKYTWGFGSEVGVDANNNIYILSRSKSVADPNATPAPPVTVFDNNGNFIRGWGGEDGPGYQWPTNEHAIFVDYKGFVWIAGNELENPIVNPTNLRYDNQILKFTKEGKFVMAIGQNGQMGSNSTDVLRGTTGLYLYPKTNELFVSDGYGNSRIVVYDADTGKVKRMWGAYGNKPLDVQDRPAVPPPPKLPFCPMICTVWPALQQFSVPHDVIVSIDGLVYVADRGNKRVQMFTTDGKFIAEQFLGLDSGAVEQGTSVSLSPDERFLYVGGQPALIWILNSKTLEVLGSYNYFPELPSKDFPPTHMMTADHKGNIFVADRHGPSSTPTKLASAVPGGVGARKIVFKGYSAKTACPPCQSTRNMNE